MAGRLRKPTASHLAEGTRIRNERDGEPKNLSPIGDPPKHFTEEQKAAWRELVAGAHAGSLSEQDRVTMEIAATNLAKFRSKGTNGVPLLHALAKLGMTPTSRSNLKVIPAQPQPGDAGHLPPLRGGGRG